MLGKIIRMISFRGSKKNCVSELKLLKDKHRLYRHITIRFLLHRKINDKDELHLSEYLRIFSCFLEEKNKNNFYKSNIANKKTTLNKNNMIFFSKIDTFLTIKIENTK